MRLQNFRGGGWVDYLKQITTKSDKRLYGYGMRIIGEIVDKYNGTLERGITDGEYVVKILLNMNGGGGKCSE